jgi:hypothetical protein
MSTEPENLVLEYLRRIDLRLGKVEERLGNVVERLASLEDQTAGLRRDFMRLVHRIDGFEGRLDRIDRRFDLTSA